MRWPTVHRVEEERAVPASAQLARARRPRLRDPSGPRPRSRAGDRRWSASRSARKSLQRVTPAARSGPRKSSSCQYPPGLTMQWSIPTASIHATRSPAVESCCGCRMTGPPRSSAIRTRPGSNVRPSGLRRSGSARKRSPAIPWASRSTELLGSWSSHGSSGCSPGSELADLPVGVDVDDSHRPLPDAEGCCRARCHSHGVELPERAHNITPLFDRGQPRPSV